MAALGGKDVKETFRKMFQYIFPNHILAMFSWKGTADKQPFCKLDNIKRTLYEAAKINHKDLTCVEYDNFAKNYVRHAKFRKVQFFLKILFL